MADFIPQAVWEIPSKFTATTQQKADEFNIRYQAAINCAALLKGQIEQIQAAIANLNAQTTIAQSDLSVQRTRLQNLNTQAQTQITRANQAQADSATYSTNLGTQATAIANNRTSLNTSQAIIANTQTNGLPYSAQLAAIAGLTRANPGILGINASNQWQWFPASGASFVIEIQSAVHIESNVNTPGGSVTANTYTTRKMSDAFYGNMRGNLGIAEDIIDEVNNKLDLSAGTNRIYFWKAVAIACSTDSFKSRWLRDNTALTNQSMSTQMVADTNSAAARQFNLEIYSDCVLSVTGANVALRFQSIHGAANSNTPTAALGYPGQISTNVNSFFQIEGWRIRYT